MKSLDSRIEQAEKQIGIKASAGDRLFIIYKDNHNPVIQYYNSYAAGQSFNERIPDLPGGATAEQIAAYKAKYIRETDNLIIDDLP